MSQRKITVCDRCSKEIDADQPIVQLVAHEAGNGKAKYADVHATCLGDVGITFTERPRRGRKPVVA